MIAADQQAPRLARLLAVSASGKLEHLPRSELALILRPGDVVVANDAATLPASLHGRHAASGAAIEIRLAGWLNLGDPTRFIAVCFGPGDHRMPTEDRPPPPPLRPGDRLSLGPLTATIECLLGHPRLCRLRFSGTRPTILTGLAAHGRPIQYAHVPELLALWDVWTKIATEPAAFEPPSAGFALDWHMLASWRSRGIHFATLTHAAGISSTGDPLLDLRLPFDEPYRIPKSTALAISQAKAAKRKIIAIGTSVVRALESAADRDGGVRDGSGMARGRIGEGIDLRVVDAIVTGVHHPGESHFELLRAFAEDSLLQRMVRALAAHGYRGHEFGDSLLIHRNVSRTTLKRDVPQPDSAETSYR
jgi:S-adenosylmethionine:tRNA ribosyltransferase-isomerase